MFMSVLFIIAKKWEQPKCPSVDRWLNKMWYIHTVEYYSTTNRNAVLMHATTWMNLETIMLNETSQSKYHTLCDATHMKVQNREIFRDTKYLSGCLGLGGRQGLGSQS